MSLLIRRHKNLLAFISCWVFVFLLYLPASQAGRVGDFPGWVHFLNSVSFFDYINRKGSGIPSMYQFTQVLSYLFYQVFGANAWLWHLLYITLQALNSLLLFVFFDRLFCVAGLRFGRMAAFFGVLLFCACPHISEVVVWEPSFHYLLGLLFMLAVLLMVQAYLLAPRPVYLWVAGGIFLLSTFSLEVFYLTPLFTAMLAVHYRVAMHTNQRSFRNALYGFLVPQLLFFLLHIGLLRLLYHTGVGHIGTAAIQLNAANLSKLPKYVFHILFMGRYFPDALRGKVYHWCEAAPALWLVYGLAAAGILAGGLRFRSMPATGKAIYLLFLWSLLSLCMILPLWFPDTGLSIYDRYTYVPDAFIFMLVALVFTLIRNRYAYVGCMVFYLLVNIRFTHRINAYWQQSAHIVNSLVYNFPNDAGKKVLLLNLPECLQGMQMIGTRDDGEFRMMYNAIMPVKATNDIYDIEAFNMNSPDDGAHVTVLNDSTVRVTLNQWGTWWLYYGLGAMSYENADFRVNMKDQGHFYELVLKHSANEYKLLYVTGSQWKTVDMLRKNTEQY